LVTLARRREVSTARLSRALPCLSVAFFLPFPWKLPCLAHHGRSVAGARGGATLLSQEPRRRLLLLLLLRRRRSRTDHPGRGPAHHRLRARPPHCCQYVRRPIHPQVTRHSDCTHIRFYYVNVTWCSRAVGDVHGDLNQTRAALTMAGVLGVEPLGGMPGQVDERYILSVPTPKYIMWCPTFQAMRTVS
jgi:hypothetical protein